MAAIGWACVCARMCTHGASAHQQSPPLELKSRPTSDSRDYFCARCGFVCAADHGTLFRTASQRAAAQRSPERAGLWPTTARPSLSREPDSAANLTRTACHLPNVRCFQVGANPTPHAAPEGLGTARQCTARQCTAWHGSARHGTARHGTARHGSARHGTAQHTARRAAHTAAGRRRRACAIAHPPGMLYSTPRNMTRVAWRGVAWRGWL